MNKKDIGLIGIALITATTAIRFLLLSQSPVRGLFLLVGAGTIFVMVIRNEVPNESSNKTPVATGAIAVLSVLAGALISIVM